MFPQTTGCCPRPRSATGDRKRETGSDTSPEGRISSLIHDRVVAGQSLRVGAAFGDFSPELPAERPLALLSAGVGITPMISALNALAETRTDRPVLFAHAARSQADHVLRQDLQRASEALPKLRTVVFYENAREAGNLGAAQVFPGTMRLSSSLLSPFREADFYLCGPIGFMREQWSALVKEGLSPTQLRREVFGPELLDHLL